MKVAALAVSEDDSMAVSLLALLFELKFVIKCGPEGSSQDELQ